jgi:hypothetical protein
MWRSIPIKGVMPLPVAAKTSSMSGARSEGSVKVPRGKLA